MKFKVIPNQKTLQSLGYKEEKTRTAFEYKKPIKKNKDYPRFHIIIENDQASIHIDKRRRHGFMQKWLGLTKGNNIIYHGVQIDYEKRKIEIETIYNEIVETRNNINNKIFKLNTLRQKLK